MWLVWARLFGCHMRSPSASCVRRRSVARGTDCQGGRRIGRSCRRLTGTRSLGAGGEVSQQAAGATCEELSELCTVADISGRLASHSRDSVEFDAQFGIGPGVERAPCVTERASNSARLGCAEALPVHEEGDLPLLRSPRRIGPDRCHRIQVIAALQTDANLGSREVMRTCAGVSRSWDCGGDGK